MFNFLFDVSIPCVSLSLSLSILNWKSGVHIHSVAVVVAFGDGQVDGALITLFNLYQASAAKKSQRCALPYWEFLSFVTMPTAFTIYIRVCACVPFFSINSATGNYWSGFFVCVAVYAPPAKWFGANFMNFSISNNSISCVHVSLCRILCHYSLSWFCVSFSTLYRFRHKIQRCLQA